MKKQSVFTLIKAAIFAVLAISVPASAQAASAADILRNLADIGPAGVLAITALSYLVGAVFAFLSVMNMVKMGNEREEKGPLIAKAALFLLGAVFLISLPSFIETGEDTVFDGGTTRGSSQGIDGF
ncbi:hypothetical protein [Alcanivorax sp. 1008]|uniref:hypothetical protein n=1 Tax=Alcanivorax sp. 1008 TaxID=2816853 RepID=UPI001DF253C4|nr:hypothetical protein [Alcanivorax sp. 1008]MCC1496708.1 hypothetical protein [Alcanivorax sp. 1008]